MHVKLLIDEDLSPSAARHLRETHGVDAVHLRDRGRLGLTDGQVLTYAYEEDRVLVTANVADFEQLARAVGTHPGIVLIEEGDLKRDEQVRTIARVVNYLLGIPGDLVNRAVYVSAGSIVIVDLPS